MRPCLNISKRVLEQQAPSRTRSRGRVQDGVLVQVICGTRDRSCNPGMRVGANVVLEHAERDVFALERERLLEIQCETQEIPNSDIELWLVLS